MSLKKINEAYDVRSIPVSKQITTADLTAAATTQSIDFDAALPTDAVLTTSWVDVDEAFASTGTATSASKTGGEGTYTLTDGLTVLLDVDNAGEQTATFNFAAGSQECNTYFPVSDLDGTQVNVSVDGGANQLVTFATPCTTSAHVRAQLAGVTGASISQASTAKAAYIPTNTVDAPFSLTNGLTAICDVDDDGADTATWTAARAVSAGSGLAIVDIDGETLTLKIDGGTVQTITFGAGDTTAATACATINAQLVGGYAVVNTGEIDIYSDTLGTNSIVEITGGTAAAELGQSVAENTEATSDAADCTAVTIAEIKTWLEAAWTGAGSGVTVTDIGSNRFSIISNTTGVDSELDIQASTALTALGLSVVTVVGTADQPLITSDTLGTGSSIAVTDVDSGLTWASATAGTGDAVDSTAVTAAEVVAVFDTDFTNGSVHEVSGSAFSITSGTTGASSELDFGAGTANTALGLSDETIVGVDATNGTATIDVGIKSGDTDAILDGANVTSATGNICGPKGVAPDGNYSGKTLQVKVDSNVNVNTLTSGDMTVWALYQSFANRLS